MNEEQAIIEDKVNEIILVDLEKYLTTLNLSSTVQHGVLTLRTNGYFFRFCVWDGAIEDYTRVKGVRFSISDPKYREKVKEHVVMEIRNL